VNNISSQITSFIKQQLESQENLNECLVTAKALNQVALSEDFLTYEKFVIHDYLFGLNNLISQACSICEAQLDILLQNRFPISDIED
jgi:hypothetical protein